MASDRAVSRRRYSAELKVQVLAECDAPDASVAKVAMVRGINANVVHRWRQLARQSRPVVPAHTGEFVPVSLVATATPAKAREIEIELRRGTTAMTITWPVAAAGDCAAWLRELLR